MKKATTPKPIMVEEHDADEIDKIKYEEEGMRILMKSFTDALKPTADSIVERKVSWWEKAASKYSLGKGTYTYDHFARIIKIEEIKE